MVAFKGGLQIYLDKDLFFPDKRMQKISDKKKNKPNTPLANEERDYFIKAKEQENVKNKIRIFSGAIYLILGSLGLTALGFSFIKGKSIINKIKNK